MNGHALVYVDVAGQPQLAGRLWARQRKGQESATFEYDRRWLENPVRFSLEPALHLGPGPFHTSAGKALFGALGDSAPDRWGRILLRREERRLADRDKRAPRTLGEIDYLLRVDDESRQGALRFAETEGGPFLEPGGVNRIPPLIELPRLLAASERIGEDKESDEDLRLLLAPGSSLGGARPKASVRDKDGALAIAKFPQKSDEVRSVLWEAVALRLAGMAGLTVPVWRLTAVARKAVLLVRRFDRSASGARIPFLSAISMLGAKDHEPHSYLEIADAISRHGAAPAEDLKQLWRRIVFNVLISNTDDHLRNHAFLSAGVAGWRLSPAYDLNPTPTDLKPRVLSTMIDSDDGTASLDRAYSVAGYFRVAKAEARKIAAEVGGAVIRWRAVAAEAGLRAAEIDRMASAFEHADLPAAAAGSITANPRVAPA